MRKSIFTLVIFASIQAFSFAQQGGTMTVDENIERIENIIADKTDITGSFANTGNWEIFVDDALVDISNDTVVEIENSDLTDLLRAGLVFVKEDITTDACYRYRVVSKEGSAHKMYLYNCNF